MPSIGGLCLMSHGARRVPAPFGYILSVRRLKAQGKEGMSIVKAVSIQVCGARQAAPTRCRVERTRTFFSKETIHEHETPRDLVDRHRHVRPAGACCRPVAALSH